MPQAQVVKKGLSGRPTEFYNKLKSKKNKNSMDSMKEKQRKTCLYDKNGNCLTPNCPFKHDPPRKVADNTFGIEEKEDETEKKERLARLGAGRGRGASILPAWMTNGTQTAEPTLGEAPGRPAVGRGGPGPQPPASPCEPHPYDGSCAESKAQGQGPSSRSGLALYGSSSSSRGPTREDAARAPATVGRSSFANALYGSSSTNISSLQHASSSFGNQPALGPAAAAAAGSLATNRNKEGSGRGGQGGYEGYSGGGESKMTNLNSFMNENLNRTSSVGGSGLDNNWEKRSVTNDAYVAPAKDKDGQYIPPPRSFDRNTFVPGGGGGTGGYRPPGGGGRDDRYPPSAALGLSSVPRNPPKREELASLGLHKLKAMCEAKGLRMVNEIERPTSHQTAQLTKVCIDRIMQAVDFESYGFPRSKWPKELLPKVGGDTEPPAKKQRIADSFGVPASTTATSCGMNSTAQGEEEKIARMRVKDATVGKGRGRGVSILPAWMTRKDPELTAAVSVSVPASTSAALVSSAVPAGPSVPVSFHRGVSLGDGADDEEDEEEEDIFKIATVVADTKIKQQKALSPLTAATNAATAISAENAADDFLSRFASNLTGSNAATHEPSAAATVNVNASVSVTSNSNASAAMANMSKRAVSNLPAWMTKNGNGFSSGSYPPPPLPAQSAGGSGAGDHLYAQNRGPLQGNINNSSSMNRNGSMNHNTTHSSNLHNQNNRGRLNSNPRPKVSKGAEGEQYDMMQVLFESG